MDFTWRKAVVVAALLSIALLGGLSAWSHLSDGPEGYLSGRLAPCPDRANCVCSRETDAEHAIEPIAFEGSVEDALAQLVDVLGGMSDCELRVVEDAYVHATFTTSLLRFVDDVEFVPSWEEQVIHVRSASRVGVSDFGANRSRVERIRAAFAAAGS